MSRFKARADVRRVESLLAALIDIPSVNPSAPGGTGEGALAQAIHDHLLSLGLHPTFQEVHPGRPNVLAPLPCSRHESLLVFEAHMDTVATSGRAQAAAYRQGGRLFGRGACDTKGSIAAMLEALRLLREVDASERCGVLFAATVDEEFSGSGAQRLVDEYPGILAAIVGEPTDLRVVVAHRGVLRFRLRSHGVAAHTSQPHLGRNAIHCMASVVARLTSELVPSLQQYEHTLVPAPPLHVTGIEGGSGDNVIPSECVATLERRLNPGETAQSALEGVDEFLERCRRDGLEVTRDDPFLVISPVEVDPLHPLVQAVLRAEESVLDESLPPVGVPYGTDASMFAAAGIPAVVFGPGSIDQAHTDDEWVSLEDVTGAAEVLAEAALLLASERRHETRDITSEDRQTGVSS